jgi:non-canonical (house-cleaning) NTP pyrophosphatase
MQPLTFYIGSGSAIKINALKEALEEAQIYASVNGFSEAQSGIAEQPFGSFEILQGAVNRVFSNYQLDPRADLYFAAENGITYSEAEDKYFDYAVCLVFDPYSQKILWVNSQDCEFPKDVTERVLSGLRGTTTVGSILQKEGLVRSSKDPHLDLCGKFRKEILKNAFVELLVKLNG